MRHRRRRRNRAAGTALSRATQPNARWCADYKGEFLLGNRRYCCPLTITDFASRCLLTCEALLTTQEKFAFTVFERTFKEFGPQENGRHERMHLTLKRDATKPASANVLQQPARFDDFITRYTRDS